MISRIIRTIPIPISGIMLSFSAVDTIFQDSQYDFVSGSGMKDICAIIAFVIFILLTAKVFVCPAQIKDALNKGSQAAIIPTYSMTMMNLSVFFKPVLGTGSFVIWWIAIGLHLILVGRFTYKFILHLQWQEVFISYVVGYAGIANAAITSPAYDMQNLGQAAFWTALCSVSCVFIIGITRHLKLPEMDEGDEFLFMVIASPMSVCLTGYLRAFTDISTGLLLTLFCVATLFYIIALAQVPKFLKRSFYPSYASFTFPFVISAIGAKTTMKYLISTHSWFPLISIMVTVESIIALILVLYTFIRYCIYIAKSFR